MSTIYIRNSKQLEDVMLEKAAATALKESQAIIKNVIQRSIEEYYDEYDPQIYRRTNRFLNSLLSSKIVRSGNSIKCEVRIDPEYLNYHYQNQGFYPNIPATGLDVVRWANREVPGDGNHGGTVDAGREEGFWDISMQDLGGKTGILSIIASELKRQGFIVIGR